VGDLFGTIMAVRTRFTELVGCRLPLQLAVLGGVGTLELATAVEQAGGLGMVPHLVPVPEPRRGALGKGFLIPYLPPLEEVVEDARRVRLTEFFWGEPQAAIATAVHSAGSVVSWQVGSADEARAAEAAGCDLVVAQGVEAGGHVRGTQPLDELLAAVLGAVSVPVVAAGGIGSAERVAQLIAAGADAVRVGTRFLACPECNTHPAYVEALIAASAGDAVLTDHFDGDGQWPAPVRVLRLSLEGAVRAGNRSTSPPTRSAEAPLAMACYAGLSVDSLRVVKPASEVVRELTSLLAF
jgi:NAD(P)H-dependent flavin oxidoreductase YrpB (nitropropane dioxygenase family)